MSHSADRVPTLTVDQISIDDYLAANAGQTFYGLVNLLESKIYLVTGGPTVSDSRYFRLSRGSVPPFKRKVIEAGLGTNGQGGHAVAVANCNMYYMLTGGNIRKLAGFSLTKTSYVVGVYTIAFRSGYNIDTFPDRPGDEEAQRTLPPAWAQEIQCALDAAMRVCQGLPSERVIHI